MQQRKRTRSIIVTDSDHVILSALQVGTITQRFFEGKTETDKGEKKGEGVYCPSPTGRTPGSLVTGNRKAEARHNPKTKLLKPKSTIFSLSHKRQWGKEKKKKDYTFIKEDVFRRMARRDEFIEWAEVHGNLYGTSRKRLEAMLDKGINVILDVDTQGARQIRKKYNDGIYIFILPPSLRALKERLKKRMCNSREEIQRRLKRAVDEIKEYKKYDYVIVNTVFDTAIEEMKAIISFGKVTYRQYRSIVGKEKFFNSEGAVNGYYFASSRD